MMLRLGCFLIMGLSIVMCWAALPDNYQSLSALDKQQVQWNQILATKYSESQLPNTYPPPNTNGTELYNASFLLPTFTWYGDEMPDNRRRSFISPYATVAKVVFRTTKNTPSGFTGMFQSGGRGLMRIALNPVRFQTSVNDFALTFITKIYIDGTGNKDRVPTYSAFCGT